MSRITCWATVLAVAVAFVPNAGSQEEATPADWAREIKLLLYGGPPASDLEILLNDEMIARVDAGSPPPTLDLGRSVVEGTNGLTVRLSPPAEPREATERFRVSVAPVTTLDGGRTKIGTVLVDLSVPEDLAVDEACEEVRYFRAGPALEPDARLKKRFWLYIHGPSLRHAVTVVVNGTPVADVTSGNQVLEITSSLSKGKNEVEFRGRASCVGELSGGQEFLVFDIGTADSRMEAMSMGSTLATFELHRDRPLEPFTKKVVVRAW